MKTKHLLRTNKNPNKIVYLTFDDGPRPITKRILDILAQYQVVGTFFVLEPKIRRFPAYIRRMVKEGHAIGLHGVTHRAKQFYASKQSILKELSKTNKTFKKTCGKKTFLIRTPYGSSPFLKPAYARAIRLAGYRLWDWNVDSLDWKYKDKRLVKLVIKKVRHLEKSSVHPVILMHDLKETAQFLPMIILFLKSRGYVFKKLNYSLSPIQFVK